MLKLLIGGAVGFGIGWVVFKRPQDQARQMWTEMARAVVPGQDPAATATNAPTPKLQGFGYARTRWN